MILLALAALAQQATADTHGLDSLMICAAAVQEAGSEAANPVALHYYLLEAVRADHRGRSLYARRAELEAQLPVYRSRFQPGGPLAGRAAAVDADCARDHPLARSGEAARLPDDPGDRSILCYDMVGYYRRLQIAAPPAGLEPDRTAAAEAGFESRIPQVDTRMLFERSTRLILASLELGNIETLTRACIAELGG